MPTPIRKRRFGSNNTKKRSRKKNSRKKNSRKGLRGKGDSVKIDGVDPGKPGLRIERVKSGSVGNNLNVAEDSTWERLFTNDDGSMKDTLEIPVFENGKTVYKTMEEIVKHGDGRLQVPYFLDEDKQLVVGKRNRKRKERPLSFPPGAPEREFGPPPLDEVEPVVRGKQQHGSMMDNAAQLKRLRTVMGRK